MLLYKKLLLMTFGTTLVSRWILLGMKNVQKKTCRENKEAHFMFRELFFFFFENRVWDNVDQYGKARQVTGDNIMLHGKYAICMPGN